ncbi:MAG TPA: tetratricopeptide repeat protein [Gemmataceae bacterium]|jgi:predicted Zn-dependent protease|nr:tetratricopeptide repeat protein [Gemmataceae bacterium]
MTGKSRKEQLQEMLADDPKDPFLRYGLGMEYVSEGNDEEAVRQFRALVAATPDYVPAYQQAGQALLRLGKPHDAQELLRAGIEAALKQGDQHAAGEMQELLASLE